MNEQKDFETETGISREGVVVKGSRIVPVLSLIVVIVVYLNLVFWGSDTKQVYEYSEMLELILSKSDVKISNVVNGTVDPKKGGKDTKFSFTPTFKPLGPMTFRYEVSEGAQRMTGNATVVTRYTHAQMLELIMSKSDVKISKVVNGAVDPEEGGKDTVFSFTPKDGAQDMTFHYEVSEGGQHMTGYATATVQKGKVKRYTHAQMLELTMSNSKVKISNVVKGTVDPEEGGKDIKFSFTPKEGAQNMTFDYEVSQYGEQMTGNATVVKRYTHAQMLELIMSNSKVKISDVVNGTVDPEEGGKDTKFSFTPTFEPLGPMTFHYEVSEGAQHMTGNATVYPSLSFVNRLKEITYDVPNFIKSQIKYFSVLILCSLIAGLAGLVYRRAFWFWFLVAFVILTLTNYVLSNSWAFYGSGIGQEHIEKLNFEYDRYLLTELFLIMLLLLYGLRKQPGAIDDRKKRNSIIRAALLILLAVAWLPWIEKLYDDDPTVVWQMAGLTAILLSIGLWYLWAALAAFVQGTERKNIVVCLDGTWNQPGTTDFGYLAETNVFKLFNMLKGTTASKHYKANRCKEYLDDMGFARQTALYYHGVGNKVENSALGQFFGGAFGIGASAIVERAYLDVVRVYRPGDRIFIFGFSRGAAIARLVAGVIGGRGIPKSLWTLRVFGRHWTVWKSSKKIEDVPVEVLGCWDTVGAFGLAKNILGIPFQKINLLKNLDVSLCVKRAYHMVALDETRDSFEPTLMDADPTTPNRIIEVWFSGNHSNVGGGYATDKLSNVTLDFLLRHLSSGYAWDDGMAPGDESWGLYLSARKKAKDADGNGKDVTEIAPDPLGQLRHSTGAMYSYAPRKLPIHAVVHDSVFDRMRDALPVYAPQSLFDLNEELVAKRGAIEAEVKRLVETSSIEDEEFERILAWSKKNLSLTKWSKYLESQLDEHSKLGDKLKPAEEMSNHSTG